MAFCFYRVLHSDHMLYVCKDIVHAPVSVTALCVYLRACGSVCVHGGMYNNRVPLNICLPTRIEKIETSYYTIHVSNMYHNPYTNITQIT